jgi:hypothetical protein
VQQVQRLQLQALQEIPEALGLKEILESPEQPELIQQSLGLQEILEVLALKD